MKIKLFPVLAWLLLLPLLLGVSCDRTTKPEEESYGKLIIKFRHKIDGAAISFDTLKYINAAGNHYLVNEIQYFVSDVRLWKDGKDLLLDKYEDIHYVDTDLPETWNYLFADPVPAGDYDSISFVFGITEEKNQSFMFVNPPESYMFWPEYLGGGYHYLKLNGKWKDTTGILRPFNFHLGIGQMYDDQGEITGFVQNYFTVNLPASFLTVKTEETFEVTLVMNVEKWFEEPHIFDFNYWGGDIMENQAAMQVAKENGRNVFSVENN